MAQVVELCMTFADSVKLMLHTGKMQELGVLTEHSRGFEGVYGGDGGSGYQKALFSERVLGAEHVFSVTRALLCVTAFAKIYCYSGEMCKLDDAFFAVLKR